MMRNRRRLLLAAGGSVALGGCDYSLEHGLFNACRAELPAQLARNEAVLAAWNVRSFRDTATGTIEHPSLVYLLDRDGRIAFAAAGGAEPLAMLLERL